MQEVQVFSIPDAPKFTEFLVQQTDGELTVSEPENVRVGKTLHRINFRVLLDGVMIGTFTLGLQREDKNGTVDRRRMYHGSIPGIVNTARSNAFALCWDDYDSFGNNDRTESEFSTAWRRIDGHTQIPFP